MARVTVVGSLNMDLVTVADKIPAPGETVIGGDLRTVPGGKGANQAVAAARMGARVSMIGQVGSDAFATVLKDNLAADGIHQKYVSEAPGASGVALIVVDAAGQNSIVVAPGANARLTAAHVDVAREAIKGAGVILLQLEIPLEAVRRAAELGREHGATIILNPAPAQPLPPELLAYVDVIVPNESETASLTGLPVSTRDELVTAAAALRAMGIGTVILTLGERGALLAQEDGPRLYPPFVMERVVDTTAAGDAFVGGLAAALAEGQPMAAAVAWGNAAGALAVTRAGAQPSLPSRDEVITLLQGAAVEQLEGVPL